MLKRLTRTKRLLAGRILALAYMVCVLAPVSLGSSNGALAAPCLTDPDHAVGLAHVHKTATGTGQHVHHGLDGHTDHKKTSDHDGVSAGTQVADTQLPSQSGNGHKMPGACCSVFCVSALPASVTEIVAPSAPTSFCALEIHRDVANHFPPTLYRPPIS